jgi:hypothetical protein
MWQVALVAASSGLIAVALRKLSKQAFLKVAINFLMVTILIWLVLMAADICVAAFRGTLLPSREPPMLALLGVAGILSLIGQLFRVLRGYKRQSAAVIDRKPPALEPTPNQKSQRPLSYEPQKRLIQR